MQAQGPGRHGGRDQPQLACVVDPKGRHQLARWVRGQRIEHRLQLRATIVWQVLIQGQSPAAVAESLHLTVKTVRKWCHRYQAGGIEGLHDMYRSGAPSRFTVGQRYALIAIACDTPANYGHPDATIWTLDLLTVTAGARVDGPVMSRSSVQRTLTEVDLRPHKMRTWLHSPDPLFKEKVNDVVGLYLEPPPDAVVLSIDEKTSIQALERPYETKPARAGDRAANGSSTCATVSPRSSRPSTRSLARSCTTRRSTPDGCTRSSSSARSCNGRACAGAAGGR